MWLPTTSLTVRATGTASPAQAWQRYVELDRWPTWSPQVTRVEADGRRLCPGLTGRVVGPLGVSVGFRVTDVHDREWTWEVSLPAGLSLVMRHVVLAHPHGSQTELHLRGAAPLVVGYAVPARVALQRLVSGQA